MEISVCLWPPLLSCPNHIVDSIKDSEGQGTDAGGAGLGRMSAPFLLATADNSMSS